MFYRYVIVQFPLTDDQMNFCEVEVFAIGRLLLINNLLSNLLLIFVEENCEINWKITVGHSFTPHMLSTCTLGVYILTARHV